MTDSSTQTRYRIEGMDCAGCATKIDTAVRRMTGVSDVAVSVTAGAMTVHHDAASDLSAIEKKVIGLGYGVSAFAVGIPPTPSHAHYDHAHAGHDHGAHDHEGHDHGDHPPVMPLYGVGNGERCSGQSSNPNRCPFIISNQPRRS